MGRRTAVRDESRLLYALVFQGDQFMLNRLEVIRRTGRDSYPDSSSSAILEQAIEGTVEGKPLKALRYALDDLNPNVRAAIEQLAHMRDAGELGA